MTHSREYERNAGMRDADESVPAEIARGRESNSHANTATHRAGGAGDSRLKRPAFAIGLVSGILCSASTSSRRRRTSLERRPLHYSRQVRRDPPSAVSIISAPRSRTSGIPTISRVFYKRDGRYATMLVRRRRRSAANFRSLVARARGCGMPAALT